PLNQHWPRTCITLYGSEAELAAASLAVNFAAWGAMCGRMAHALGQRYGWAAEAVRGFAQFATTPADAGGSHQPKGTTVPIAQIMLCCSQQAPLCKGACPQTPPRTE